MTSPEDRQKKDAGNREIAGTHLESSFRRITLHVKYIAGWAIELNVGNFSPAPSAPACRDSKRSQQSHAGWFRNAGHQEAADLTATKKVVNALDAALVDNPESDYLHNSKAWLLATCKQAEVRNGKLAVEHATKACELTKFKAASDLDTLAAACAEAADFESAIKHAQAAIDLSEDEAQKGRFIARLELYKGGQPFHE